MTDRRHHALGYGLAALIVAIDQLLKAWVVGPLALELVRHIDLLPIFDLTYVRNYGDLAGPVPGGQRRRPAGCWWRSPQQSRPASPRGSGASACAARWGRWRWCSAVPWATSWDRARLGYVVDYADLHFGAWRPFFIFNLADAAISIGVVILLLRAFLVRGESKTETVNG